MAHVARSETPRSSETRRAEAPRSMSRHLWDLEWPSWSFDGGIRCEVGAFEDAVPFIEAHYPSIFHDDAGRFLDDRMTPAKRRFLEQSDVFLFREGDAVVGITICHPTDWSTYYIRSTAFLPDARQRGLAVEFASWLEQPLRNVGVQRIEADCSPANAAVNRALLSSGFVVTATLNSERWGAMLHYTRYLSDEAAACFQRQFLSVPNNGKRNSVRDPDSMNNIQPTRRTP